MRGDRDRLRHLGRRSAPRERGQSPRGLPCTGARGSTTSTVQSASLAAKGAPTRVSEKAPTPCSTRARRRPLRRTRERLRVHGQEGPCMRRSSFRADHLFPRWATRTWLRCGSMISPHLRRPPHRRGSPPKGDPGAARIQLDHDDPERLWPPLSEPRRAPRGPLSTGPAARRFRARWGLKRGPTRVPRSKCSSDRRALQASDLGLWVSETGLEPARGL
jgi:hypothetical protein